MLTYLGLVTPPPQVGPAFWPIWPGPGGGGLGPEQRGQSHSPNPQHERHPHPRRAAAGQHGGQQHRGGRAPPAAGHPRDVPADADPQRRDGRAFPDRGAARHGVGEPGHRVRWLPCAGVGFGERLKKDGLWGPEAEEMSECTPVQG